VGAWSAVVLVISYELLMMFPDQDLCSRRCPVTAADGVIRWTTAGAVIGVAAVAAVASYEHA
jgi:hypothetical protein